LSLDDGQARSYRFVRRISTEKRAWRKINRDFLEADFETTSRLAG